MVRKLRIPKKTYKRKGKLVHRKAYLKEDIGEPGRTPKAKRWYKPKEKIGWMKDMPTDERRETALNSKDGDLLACARALQALANVTKDAETKKKAQSDAKYFFSEYRKEKEGKK